MEWYGPEWSGSAEGQVESSCEYGKEYSGSIKKLGSYEVATHLVAS
jgi:hypothetical protein